jgi:hypothetical protein
LLQQELTRGRFAVRKSCAYQRCDWDEYGGATFGTAESNGAMIPCADPSGADLAEWARTNNKKQEGI